MLILTFCSHFIFKFERMTILKKKIFAACLMICAFVMFAAAANAAPVLKYKSYIDLSHLIVENSMPADPSLKQPSMEFFARVGEQSDYNLEVLSYCPHTGTHMDAPFHVGVGNPIESWRADLLMGPACVITVGKPGNYIITEQDIKSWEKKNGSIKPGDAVLFHTGHDANWSKGFDAYIKNGYTTLSADAAKYLVSKKIRFEATESISPDGAKPVAHRILLSNKIAVVENICNLGQIKSSRCTLVGNFANMKGATGVWVRILALK